MSAPNEGRQSPDPENQTGGQKGNEDQEGSGKVDQSEGKNEGKDDQTSGLESNPKHILQDHAETKTAKGTSADSAK
ncbi:hypothetical protein H2200_008989 [Cladophialophora chaetospira]|uniref:Uncharacterized protein n=1 Tax=Cladophialophora chaetospira TaxID=386627 RepID=A0AA38X550_9EURO|nr:hypothetical protein H2200_008989 [Cladophialophora chaetospira]